MSHDFGNKLDFDFVFHENDDENIDLEYKVKNTLDKDIYLLTPLFDPLNCTFQPDDQQLYAFWHSEYVLHFTKRLWPAAKELNIGVKQTPYLKKLSPGESFTEKVHIKSPYHIQYPYYFQEKNDMMDLGYDTDRYVCMSRYATFSLGYVMASQKDIDEQAIRPVQKDNLDFKPLTMESYFDNFEHEKDNIEHDLLTKTKKPVSKSNHNNIDTLPIFEADFDWLAKHQKILRSLPQKLMLIAIQE